MLLAAITKLRNGSLIKFREEHNLTQRAAAELVGVSLDQWQHIEKLDFKRASPEAVVKIAAALDTTASEVVPEELRDTNIGIRRIFYRDVSAPQLCSMAKLDLLPAHETTEIERVDISERIDELLKTLTYREREIIKLRFGLVDGHIYTLEEVGKIFKVTRERVRLVEAKAIRKLQHPVRADRLLPFLEPGGLQARPRD